MRAFGRDLIRGGHYGQRSCEPHLKAEHMAAPTNAAYVKKALANSEPSTHGRDLIRGGHYGQRSCEPQNRIDIIQLSGRFREKPTTYGTSPKGRRAGRNERA